MPDLRKDPILERWVIIATGRGNRPVDFHQESELAAGNFSPFSHGNERMTPPEVFQVGRSETEPPDSPGWNVRVVPNKFPALLPDGDLDYQGIGIFDRMNGIGTHEVVIENPDPHWDMADATPTQMRDIFTAYIERIKFLHHDKRLRYVMVFRNKGAAAGATVAHPHSQIVALPILPQQVKERLDAAREHYRRKHRCIFEDIVRQELESGARVVEANDHFVVLSPFAARFPFELQVFPRRHSHDFTTLCEAEKLILGETLTRNLLRLRVLLGDPSYNLMLHSCPNTNAESPTPQSWNTIAHDYLWHLDIVPRVTKIAGFEWGTGCYINPVAPEEATQMLRNADI